jgi:hypothetical protein
VRPMVIFANPLGAPVLDRAITLVHPVRDLQDRVPELRLVGRIRRTTTAGGEREFFCYRLRTDRSTVREPFDLLNPFPAPVRSEGTQSRGRFRLPVRAGE